MGLYRQPNDWTCGPFALKHALVTLGRLADEDTISEIVDPHWWSGADEVKLARAARHYDCDLPLVRRTDAERAHGTLINYVDRAVPVLLCVDDWSHWITIVGRDRQGDKQRFIVLDSRYEPVLHVVPWAKLRKRWRYLDYERGDDPRPLYDLHPVRPKFRAPHTARFSVERAQFLRRPENAGLAQHWDAYLGDLMEICRPKTTRAAGSMPMADFLKQHAALLTERVTYWHGDLPRSAVDRLLKNFRFVAETYALTLPASATRRAIVDMAMLLGLWAAALRGVGSMYGSDDNTCRRRVPLRRRRRLSYHW